MHIDDEARYRKIFLGEQKGIGLLNRGPKDPHVCLVILTEDDEHWFTSENSFSSFWISDLQKILQEAKDWIEQNCEPDMGTQDYNKHIQFGWKFKTLE